MWLSQVPSQGVFEVKTFRNGTKVPFAIFTLILL